MPVLPKPVRHIVMKRHYNLQWSPFLFYAKQAGSIASSNCPFLSLPSPIPSSSRYAPAMLRGNARRVLCDRTHAHSSAHTL